MRRQKEYFTGGAHPKHEAVWIVIDLEGPDGGKVLGIDDVFQQTGRAPLLAAIEDALRARAHLAAGAPLTSGGYFNDTIKMPVNFVFGPVGVTFCWNAYDIAPYVQGEILITLPSSQVEPWLTAAGTALLRETGGL
jgi:hypothetical protein